MSKFPNKPAKGQPALQAIYNSVCQIIDYLPTLEIRGDNKTISVSHSSVGTTIHANKNFSVTESGKKIYEAGSGLVLSGNVFNVEIDPNTMAFVNNRLSCTIEGGSGEGTDHKYCDNGCNSLIIAAPEDQVNGWNYIGVNPDWIAGNGMCSEGYFAVMSAILKAFSGTNQSTPFAIGSQSIQTMGTEVWVNPWWLCGDTYCQAGYTAVISAVYKYLRSLNPTSEYDTLKYNSQTSSLYWGKDNNDGGGSPTTDYVYAYYDYTGSIIFNSNNPSPYSDPSANAIYINVDWLAGNTECQAGYDAICSAVTKYLNSLTVAETDGNTLKKNGSNGFGWYKDNEGSSSGPGDGDHVFKYDCADTSLYFASNDSEEYATPDSSISANYIGVNASWLAGETQCQAGYEGIVSAIYKYLTSGKTFDSTSCTLKIDPTTSSLYWAKDQVGTPIIPSTGLTSTALTDANSVTTGIAISISAASSDSVLSCSSDGTISWQPNVTPTPPTPGDGDHVFKYNCGDTSIYFASNNADEYSTSSIDENYIGVNAAWLAGDTECKAGMDAVSAAFTKSLNALTHDATSCTLKINPTDNTLYWGEDIGANQNFLISTGLTSAAVVEEGVTVGTAVRLNSTYTSDLNVITGHSNSNNYNKVLSCNSYGAIGWVTNDAGGGGGYDGNTWYKYADAGNNSLIFSPPYSSQNGTTYICINPDWLAGNGEGCCCYEGPAAIASAIIKILTNPAFDAAAQEIINALKNKW